jgi:hypothetical protein
MIAPVHPPSFVSVQLMPTREEVLHVGSFGLRELERVEARIALENQQPFTRSFEAHFLISPL